MNYKISKKLRWGLLLIISWLFILFISQSSEAFVLEYEHHSSQNSQEQISLNFKETELTDAFRSIGEMVDKNIVTDYTAEEKTVTLRLNDVHYLEAIEFLAVANGLDYRKEGNTIFISELERLEENFGQRETRIYRLENSEPEEIKETINLVVADEDLRIDERTNSLVVTGYQRQLKEIEFMITKLDQAKRQVAIQARLQEFSHETVDQVGISWGAEGDDSEEVLLSPSGARVSITDSLSLDRYLFNLEMLEEQDKSELLANPQITAIDGEVANIELIDRVPIVESDDEDTSVSFEEVGISLEILTRIVEEDKVMVEVKPEVSKVTDYVEDIYPIIDTRRVETSVRIESGKTIIIGGLISEDEIVSQSRIPILGDIPLLGRLFRRESTRLEKKELVIFITPEIINEDGTKAGAELDRQDFFETDD